MCNEDESVWITFNGEIYNFQELRAELVAAGHQFRSHTDTEVIVHGYEEWGSEVVRRLRGMFAFALWDQRQRRLLLATDHLGKKPLFYSHDGRKFVFASEIKAILKAGVPAELDPVALHDYLTYLYFPYPSTAFRHVRKMPPGSAMEISVAHDGELRKRVWKYWDAAETAGATARLSENDLIDQARDLMEEAVKLRLISDVPLGLFLSGGLDSSAITAFASKNSAEQVKTFTIGFANNKFYDEQPVANLVAKKFRTEHHLLQADEACADYMTKVVRHFDEPFGNPTAILEYIITKLMRKHVTVAISGDGGDELLVVTCVMPALLSPAAIASCRSLSLKVWFQGFRLSCMTLRTAATASAASASLPSLHGRRKKTCTSTGSVIFLKLRSRTSTPLNLRHRWPGGIPAISCASSSAAAHNWSP